VLAGRALLKSVSGIGNASPGAERFESAHRCRWRPSGLRRTARRNALTECSRLQSRNRHENAFLERKK
jgi:hypothetical protein